MTHDTEKRIKKIMDGIHVLHAYEWLRDNVWFWKLIVAHIRYGKHIRRIRRYSKSRKIRVLFIVSEVAKWKEQKLYELMERSDVFEPIIGLSAWNRQLEELCSNEYLEIIHRKAVSFFNRFGDRHIRTVTIENGVRIHHNLKDFQPDIVYFTEPWRPCKHQDPWAVSKTALTVYTPYYTPNYGIINLDCQLDFHRLLHSYFCLNESWGATFKQHLRRLSHCVRFIPTGHPALDFFMGAENAAPNDGVIIYAPHFSFYNPKYPDSDQRFSTFDQNYREILEYAKAHAEFKWVFKPHPLLREWVKSSGLMTDKGLEQYFAEWAKIGTVCEDGDYQQLFLESRAMITDCGSFLTEYGSTGRPVIHLICSANKHVPTFLIKNLYDTYYQVHNLDEMYKSFKLVLEDRQDPNRERRIAEARKAGILGSNASQAIVDYLTELLRPTSDASSLTSSSTR